ncbi:chorion peroxidase-like [Photinus pyralis]|uniref:chorion peroxidase-like n=1 Tax=Photinus pyralis TaxID=7054 RepID=UPI0012674BE1|nr:chorion peroxidase-like [Photinus pyralis]
MRDLYLLKEPEFYKKGLYLDQNHPAYLLASFRNPSEKTLHLARYGYAALEARSKLSQLSFRYADSLSREVPYVQSIRSKRLLDECPLRGFPRCPKGFERYRAADGTCNNFRHPWRGGAVLPMQRFLPPHYDDDIQTVRQSVLGGPLPSARDISSLVHRDVHQEVDAITLMFMQWGQFLDHDLTSSAQARMFNRSVPRCCENGGVGTLPPELTHPECLPIRVSGDDWFLSQFGIRCMEFVRSAPTSRIDCDLGWREQINQVTSYIDASTVYGSDPDVSDLLRTFERGQLRYGRSRNQGPLQPPDPPRGELCRLGAITTDCFRSGDLRAGDQPALVALHTAWLRYHNRLAEKLVSLNPHWSDEKVFQEARKIIGAFVQHITYREFLPILLGKEVIELFGLELEPKGYYKGYRSKTNPTIANSFSTAAFRFGHSLVQKSFVRTDKRHRIIRNNVTLHNEQVNVENIWSLGSVDRLLLGLSNQPIQKRDEFITSELTNHLFQSNGGRFGIDLAAVNIQRGRDHGLPSYTSWRKPCGLISLKTWTDFEKVMSKSTINRFKSLYKHFDDIDLFSGGLAERPVRGGIVGPTFACIIAQQFSNLRKGDRFWYENGDFESAFTPAQLQQIRQTTLAHVLCKTLDEIETIQPFVFLSVDHSHNSRVSCNDPSVNNFDLSAWAEKPREDVDTFLREGVDYDFDLHDIESRKSTKRKKTKTTTKPTFTNNNIRYEPLKIKLKNVTTTIVHLNKKNQYGQPLTVISSKPIIANDQKPTHISSKRPTFSQQRPTVQQTPNVDGYLLGFPASATDPPQNYPKNRPSSYSFNINIQISPPDEDNIRKPYPEKISGGGHDRFHFDIQSTNKFDTRPGYNYQPYATKKPDFGPPRPLYQPPKETLYEKLPFATSPKPYTYNIYANKFTTTRPVTIPSYLYLQEEDTYNNPTYNKPHRPNYEPTEVVYYPVLNEQSYARPIYHHAPLNSTKSLDDKKFIKISSIRGQKITSAEDMKRPIYISVQQREGEIELEDYDSGSGNPSLLQVDIAPSEVRAHEWRTYDEIGDVQPAVPLLEIMRINTSTLCANEIPHPIEVEFSSLVDSY